MLVLLLLLLVAAVVCVFLAGRERFTTGKAKDKQVMRIIDKTKPVKITIQKGMGSDSGKHAYNKKWSLSSLKSAKTGMIATFSIKFAKGFEYGCRGKVGGFFIGTGKASGCKHSPDAASYRIMWNSKGGPYPYVYIPKGTHTSQRGALKVVKDCGLGLWEFGNNGAFNAGGFVDIELGVKLNTVTSTGKVIADGQLWFKVGKGKGKLIKNVIWRTKQKHNINTFSLGVFHGGPCNATRTSNMEIKDLVIYRWP